MDRAEILNTAKTLVTVDREATHGDAADGFKMVAASWSAKVGVTITAAQVCLLLADLKNCRAWGNPHHDDNFPDGAGYHALAGELAGRGL